MGEIVSVRLTWPEVYRAGCVGLSARLGALRKGFKDKFESNRSDEFGNHIIGACGEKAVAKHLGLYWNDDLDGDCKKADVGKNVQVRTVTKASHRLIIRPHDNDEHFLFLVVSELPVFHILGWVLTKEGKQDQWLTDAGNGGQAAYFVPQEFLRPMSEFCEGR